MKFSWVQGSHPVCVARFVMRSSSIRVIDVITVATKRSSFVNLEVRLSMHKCGLYYCALSTVSCPSKILLRFPPCESISKLLHKITLDVLFDTSVISIRHNVIFRTNLVIRSWLDTSRQKVPELAIGCGPDLVHLKLVTHLKHATCGRDALTQGDVLLRHK